MAEAVQTILEDMAPGLQEMAELDILSSNEIRELVKRRRKFELNLHRRSPVKEDYLRYLAYELNVYKLILSRKRKLGIRRLKKVNLSNCLHFIFERAVRKFSKDVAIWREYIEFCVRVKANTQLKKTFGRALQLHPRATELWLIAADWELKRNNVNGARTLLQQSLRVSPTDPGLWAELVRLEVVALGRILTRREVLGLENVKTKPVAGPESGEESGSGSSSDEEGVEEEAGGAVPADRAEYLKGSVISVVLKHSLVECPLLDSTNGIAVRRKIFEVLDRTIDSLCKRKGANPGPPELEEVVLRLASEFRALVVQECAAIAKGHGATVCLVTAMMADRRLNSAFAPPSTKKRRLAGSAALPILSPGIQAAMNEFSAVLEAVEGQCPALWECWINWLAKLLSESSDSYSELDIVGALDAVAKMAKSSGQFTDGISAHRLRALQRVMVVEDFQAALQTAREAFPASAELWILTVESSMSSPKPPSDSCCCWKSTDSLFRRAMATQLSVAERATAVWRMYGEWLASSSPSDSPCGCGGWAERKPRLQWVMEEGFTTRGFSGQLRGVSISTAAVRRIEKTLEDVVQGARRSLVAGVLLHEGQASFRRTVDAMLSGGRRPQPLQEDWFQDCLSLEKHCCSVDSKRLVFLLEEALRAHGARSVELWWGLLRQWEKRPAEWRRTLQRANGALANPSLKEALALRVAKR